MKKEAGIIGTLILTIFGVAVVIGIVVYINRGSRNDHSEVVEESISSAVSATTNETGVIPAVTQGTESEYSGEVLAGQEAKLLDFTKADYNKALASDKLIVLYFFANWCPICRAEFPLMQNAFDDLTTDAVIGFRVNYNDSATDANEKALASEFGVAYQHTKVFLKNGVRILKAPDSWSKDRYLSEIQKILSPVSQPVNEPAGNKGGSPKKSEAPASG